MIDRREFLAVAAAILAPAATSPGGGYVANWGTRRDIRAYAQRGKPLLTEKSLASFLMSARDTGELGTIIEQGRENLGKLLGSRFSLSPQQGETLAALDARSLESVWELLAGVAGDRSATLQVRFDNPGISQECATVIRASGKVAGEVSVAPKQR